MKTIAKALLKNSDNQFLLLRRSRTHPYWPHHLDLPGGEVEPDEGAMAAVIREVAEEAGVVIEGDGLEVVFDQLIDDHRCLLYIGSMPGEATITLSWEHDQHSWLTQDELLQAEVEVKENPDKYYMAVIELLSKRKEPL